MTNIFGCNWKDGTGYPNHQNDGRAWAWEYLRRNPVYQSAWKDMCARASEIRGHLSFADFVAAGHPKESYDSDIEILLQECHALAYWAEPPLLKNETLEEWGKRNTSVRRTFWMYPQGAAKQWGLECLAPPETNDRWYVKWQAGPFSVRFPHVSLLKQEETGRYSRANLAELKHGECVSFGSVSESLLPLDDLAMRTKWAVEIDLTKPLPGQLDTIKWYFERKQKALVDKGEVDATSWPTEQGGRRKRISKTTHHLYLRTLDALSDLGGIETFLTPGDIKSEVINKIREAMIPREDNTENSAYKKVRGWVSTSCAYISSDYKHLVLMRKK